MVARGALIKPWIFREALDGYRDVSAEERLAVYRRYVELALEHWGDDEHGRSRAREFLVWHLGFWCRYAPRREDGSYPDDAGAGGEAGRIDASGRLAGAHGRRRRTGGLPIGCSRVARSSSTTRRCRGTVSPYRRWKPRADR